MPTLWTVLLGSTLLAPAQPPASTLLERYAAGDYAAATQLPSKDFKDVRERFVRDAGKWIETDPASAPRRRFIVAAFILEAAHDKLRLHTWPEVQPLIEWPLHSMSGEELRRDGGEAERAWLRAAIALAQRGQTFTWFSSQRSRLRRVAEREPEVVHLQFAYTRWRVFHGGSIIPRAAPDELDVFLADPELACDAELLLAYTHLTQERLASAVTHAQNAVARAAETACRYVARFLLGRTFEAMDRPADAAVEYGLALEVIPGAQSATLALAALRMRSGDVQEAVTLVDRSVTQRPMDDDPWRLFAFGSYVRWPVLLADIRRLLR
jgi:hypothetical protein